MVIDKKHFNFRSRAGERYLTNEGYWVTIIEYFGWDNCTVQFDDKNIVFNKTYSNIKKGNIMNPYHYSVFERGFLGIGKYTSSRNNKPTRHYTTWYSMLRRVYSETIHKSNPTYKDVIICEEWHNFQVFAEWFEVNYKEGFHLDKDILFKGNKIYSPETCCFVPQEINTLFTKRQNNRGEYPIGVSFCKVMNSFSATINIYKVTRNLGYFGTPEQAFKNYKIAKEVYIKEVADKFREQITERVYEALYNYQVEITD